MYRSYWWNRLKVCLRMSIVRISSESEQTNLFLLVQSKNQMSERKKEKGKREFFFCESRSEVFEGNGEARRWHALLWNLGLVFFFLSCSITLAVELKLPVQRLTFSRFAHQYLTSSLLFSGGSVKFRAFVFVFGLGPTCRKPPRPTSSFTLLQEKKRKRAQQVRVRFPARGKLTP